MAEFYRSAVLAKYPVDATRGYIDWVLTQYTSPTTLPHVRALKLAADGRLWLREHVFPPAATARWHILHPDGAYEGSVELPASWTVHQIENGFLLVSQPSPTGEKIVSLHNISPAG
jgi:hypothetical protein